MGELFIPTPLVAACFRLGVELDGGGTGEDDADEAADDDVLFTLESPPPIPLDDDSSVDLLLGEEARQLDVVVGLAMLF